MNRPIATPFLAASLLAGGVALGAPPDAAPADDAPLRGPTVTTAPAVPTLVQRDFAGRLIELDDHPAAAAVKLLTLDAATTAKVDQVLLERSQILDKLVADNLELLVQLQGAREGGNQEETARLFGELSAKAQPLRDRGQLAQELMTVLSTVQGQELRRLIQEYWQAAVGQELADKRAAAEGTMEVSAAQPGRARDQRRDTREAMRKEMLDIVGGEIRRAYERTIGSAAREFDRLIADLNLTPDQESKVRRIVGDSFQASFGKASVQERTRIFWEVYTVLDEQQRAEVIRRLGPHPRIQR